ncbi:MAG: type 4a pilus biogenesis protein PilO [Armatimonas sp.]
MASKFLLKPTKKVCIGMGAVTGAILLGSVGVWFWQNGDLEAKAKIVQAKHDQVEHGERVARRLDEVKTEHEGTANKLKFLESAVSGKTYVSTMLKQIEDMAVAEKLKVLRFDPKHEPAPPPPTDPEAKKKWVPQPYDKEHADMQVQGTFWSVTRFVNRLTKFQKIVSVDAVQLLPLSPVAGTSPSLNATIKLTGFAFHDDEKLQMEAGTSTTTTPGSKPLLGAGAGTAHRNAENQVINAGANQGAAPKPGAGATQ